MILFTSFLYLQIITLMIYFSSLTRAIFYHLNTKMANSKRGQKYMMKNGLYSSCNARPQSSATHICLPVHLKANPFRNLAAFIWLAAFILTFSQCGVDAIRLQVHKVDDKSTGAEKRGGGASLMGGSFLQREQTYTPPQDNTVLLWDPTDDYRFKSRDKFYPQGKFN